MWTWHKDGEIGGVQVEMEKVDLGMTAEMAVEMRVEIMEEL